MKMKKIFIFKPNTLDTKSIGFLEGFVQTYEDNINFYITSDKLTKNISKSVGYCSDVTPTNKLNDAIEDSEWLHFNNNTSEIKICSQHTESDSKDIVCVNYDYLAFQNADVLASKTQLYGEYFNTLLNAIKPKYVAETKYNFFFNTLIAMAIFSINVILNVIHRGHTIFKYSTVLVHFVNSLTTTRWLLRNIRYKQKFTLKESNIMFSKIIDIILGFLTIYYFMKYEEEIISFIQYSAEYIIKGLKQVLNTLMGSPAGLKLNFALNRTLGMFFFYHISLWRAFIEVINPLLSTIFRFFIIPGLFGISYQAAILSDLIGFLTFHVYCIYVYAARLYGVQVRGLTSLWKLFIGRKYNPLRERVDSFQYTHNQLFIGTLGFTILLFLLPTTFLYYAVFVSFRLGLMVLASILNKIRLIFQSLPIYVIILWCSRSSKLNGAIHIEMCADKSKVHLNVTLKTLPLWLSIKNCWLPTNVPVEPYISWNGMFKGLFTGALL